MPISPQQGDPCAAGPFLAAASERLDEIPGIGPVAVILAEIGVDMFRFPTGPPVFLGKFSPASSPRREAQGQRHNRPQPLSLPNSGDGARTGHRRLRTLHFRHHLAPPAAPGRPVPWPRQRGHQSGHHQTQPCRRRRSPRQHRHPHSLKADRHPSSNPCARRVMAGPSVNRTQSGRIHFRIRRQLTSASAISRTAEPRSTISEKRSVPVYARPSLTNETKHS